MGTHRGLDLLLGGLYQMQGNFGFLVFKKAKYLEVLMMKPAKT